MHSKSVDLPAPFGPMMPTSSPAATSKVMPRLAVMPPKRLVTPRTLSRLIACGRITNPDEALRREAHHHDERDAVEDQVEPDEVRAEAAEVARAATSPPS